MSEPSHPPLVPPDGTLDAPPTGGPIMADLPCARCAYNLRGLAPDIRCPECGTPVALSLHGNWLRLADLGWLRKLRLGAALKLWGILVGFLVGAGAGAGVALGAPAVLVRAAGVVGGLFGLAALFLITSPEPTIGRAEDPITLRKAVRLCAVVGFLGGQLSQGFAPWTASMSVIVVGYALALVGVVATFGEFVYLRRFARRIPDEKLAGFTSVVMWGMGATMLAALVFGLVCVAAGVGLPGMPGAAAAGTAATPATTAVAGPAGLGVMAISACVFGLAALVFGVLNLILLIRYYGAFKRAVAEAERVATGVLQPS